MAGLGAAHARDGGRVPRDRGATWRPGGGAEWRAGGGAEWRPNGESSTGLAAEHRPRRRAPASPPSTGLAAEHAPGARRFGGCSAPGTVVGRQPGLPPTRLGASPPITRLAAEHRPRRRSPASPPSTRPVLAGSGGARRRARWSAGSRASRRSDSLRHGVPPRHCAGVRRIVVRVSPRGADVRAEPSSEAAPPRAPARGASPRRRDRPHDRGRSPGPAAAGRRDATRPGGGHAHRKKRGPRSPAIPRGGRGASARPPCARPSGAPCAR